MASITPALLGRVHELLRAAAADPTSTVLSLGEEVATLISPSGLRSEVLHDFEEVSGDSHFDILVHASDGTTSISYAPRQETPWPLRGARRRSEQDVVSVNEQMMTLQDVAILLDVMWDDTPLLERIIDEALIRKEIADRKIEMSQAERQADVDAFRSEHALHDADAMRAWLRVRGLSLWEFSEWVTQQSSRRKLRNAVAMERLASTSALSDSYDARIAVLLRYGPVSESEAQLVAAECRSGARTLLRVVADKLAKGERIMSPVCVMTRDGSGSEYVAQALGSGVGTILGPVPNGTQCDLFEVLAIGGGGRPLRETLNDALFAQWLAEQRAKAAIHWSWGRGELPGDGTPKAGQLPES